MEGIPLLPGEARRNRTKDGATGGHVEFPIQILGALLVLAAFGLVQARVFTPEARNYLVLNFLGGSVLAVDAYIGRQWGFLLLEGVWAIIAAFGLVTQARRIAHPSQPGRTRVARARKTRRLAATREGKQPHR